MSPRNALHLVKTVHTVAWAFFVACILAIPLGALHRRFDVVVVASVLILGEILVLALNSMSCPLTAVAARYTDDRRANFDIYLPEPVARYNKQIFGTILVAGWLVAFLAWISASGG